MFQKLLQNLYHLQLNKIVYPNLFLIISFNDNDKFKVYNDKETVNILSSTQEKNINAPKTEERLNEISDGLEINKEKKKKKKMIMGIMMVENLKFLVLHQILN